VADVQVLGFKELDAALAQLPEALRRQVVLTALRKAAQPMVRDARAKARRGKDPRRRGSQKQRKSGESEAMGHGADSIAARAVKSDSPNEAAVAVGPDARHWYMKLVEFGTARQSADRFLTPAFETNKERAIEAVGQELWKAIAATAKRLARHAEAGTLSNSATAALRS
jgi:HK97 gp10 family phage protein